MSKSSGVVIEAVGSSFFNAPPRAHPSRVYVVSYRDGSIRSFSGAPTFSDRVSSRFCYMVDTSEQHATSVCSPLSLVDAYAFTVELSATWRIYDPEAAVKADLADGNAVVLAWLQDEVWQIARRFPPDRAAAAESAVRAALSGGVVLDQGINVIRATAQFRADASITGATLSVDQDTHQAFLEARRMARLREMFDGSDLSAILLHLHTHPDDTGSVLTMIKAARDQDQALRLTLLDKLLENNFLQDIDAQPLRDFVLGQANAVSGSSVSMVPIARAKPSLALPQGITSGASGAFPATGASAAPGSGPVPASGSGPGSGPVPAPGSAQTASQPAPGQGVAQGYVVEDADDPGPPPPASAPQAGTPGGVANWKPIGKPRQGSA